MQKGPFRWNEISAPSFYGVSDSLRLSGDLMNRAFKGVSTSLGELEKNNTKQADDEFARYMSQFTSPGDMNNALANATWRNAMGNRANNVSADAIKQSGQMLQDNIFNTSNIQSIAHSGQNQDWLNRNRQNVVDEERSYIDSFNNTMGTNYGSKYDKQGTDLADTDVANERLKTFKDSISRMTDRRDMQEFIMANGLNADEALASGVPQDLVQDIFTLTGTPARDAAGNVFGSSGVSPTAGMASRINPNATNRNLNRYSPITRQMNTLTGNNNYYGNEDLVGTSWGRLVDDYKDVASNNKHNSSALGPFQITGSTREEFGPKVFGPNWRNTEYTPENEYLLAKAIYDSRVANNDISKTWVGLDKVLSSEQKRKGGMANVPFEDIAPFILNTETGINTDEAKTAIDSLAQQYNSRDANDLRYATDSLKHNSNGFQFNPNNSESVVTEESTPEGDTFGSYFAGNVPNQLNNAVPEELPQAPRTSRFDEAISTITTPGASDSFAALNPDIAPLAQEVPKPTNAFEEAIATKGTKPTNNSEYGYGQTIYDVAKDKPTTKNEWGRKVAKIGQYGNSDYDVTQYLKNKGLSTEEIFATEMNPNLDRAVAEELYNDPKRIKQALEDNGLKPNDIKSILGNNTNPSFDEFWDAVKYAKNDKDINEGFDKAIREKQIAQKEYLKENGDAINNQITQDKLDKDYEEEIQSNEALVERFDKMKNSMTITEMRNRSVIDPRVIANIDSAEFKNASSTVDKLSALIGVDKNLPALGQLAGVISDLTSEYDLSQEEAMMIVSQSLDSKWYSWFSDKADIDSDKAKSIAKKVSESSYVENIMNAAKDMSNVRSGITKTIESQGNLLNSYNIAMRRGNTEDAEAYKEAILSDQKAIRKYEKRYNSMLKKTKSFAEDSIEKAVSKESPYTKSAKFKDLFS